VLITPFSVNYNLIYECFRHYMFAKNYAFLHFLRAISEKPQHIKLWKFAVFYTSRGTSSLPSMNKIRDVRVFSLVHLTWNDPDTKKTIAPQLYVIWRNWHHFRTQDIDFYWNNLFSILPQKHDTNYNWCKFCIFTNFCTKKNRIAPQLNVIWRNWHHFRTQDIDFH
jgi:hypothetical protein